MDDFSTHRQTILDKGYTVLDHIYNDEEIDAITSKINNSSQSNPTFRKSADLFAIRQFLRELPELTEAIFNNELTNAISSLFGDDYFVVKSIYFDKPAKSNWFVAWHQDLTISVDAKADIAGFSGWTKKHNQFAVQPPVEILEDNFTIRIHLDDTDLNNGALKIIPGSHLKGIKRAENMDWTMEPVETYEVPKGGIMIMRPLLMHASDRTTNDAMRRVIHIEFSRAKLPGGVNWSELSA